MIACFDVHYFEDYANAAAVVFNNWDDSLAVDSVETGQASAQLKRRGVCGRCARLSVRDQAMQTWTIEDRSVASQPKVEYRG